MNRRAEGITADYLKKCRTLDRLYALQPVQQGQPGPAEQHLATYGPICKVVVGHCGEFSEDLHTLVRNMATAGAQRQWRSMLAVDQENARAQLQWQYRSRIFFAHAAASSALVMRRYEALVCRNPRGGLGPDAHPTGGDPADARELLHQRQSGGALHGTPQFHQ